MIGKLAALTQNPIVTGDSFSPLKIAVIAGIAIVAMIVTSFIVKKKDE